MGFNVASVSYLSLASELSGEKGRSRTVSIMWFVMIVGIIITAATLSRLLDPYSPELLQKAFTTIGLTALGLGLLGLVGLEPRHARTSTAAPERTSWQVLLKGVLGNSQARHFFFYLILMLAAILGQDVLLEPFAGEAFGLPVTATTRITSIWGVCVLLTLLAAGLMERRVGKRVVAQLGAAGAAAGFLIIAASGVVGLKSLFYGGVVLLGLGTGLATVSNLSLMLDMTTTRVGLFIGAWGIADAMARLLGTVLSGAVRDTILHLTQNAVAGYVTVFVIEAAMLLASWVMLLRIDVQRFRQQSMGIEERAAMIEEV